MAFWSAAALLLWPVLNRDRVRNVVLCAGTAAVVTLAIGQHRTAREWEQPIDITRTIEYKTARWLAANMPQARVFAPGTIGFWLNAFTDNPQITGGFDNGILNPLAPHVIFQVYAGDKQQVMIDLMNAYGVDAVIGGGKDSAEFYHPIAHPEKFAGMTELWRDRGDAVYSIPRESRSLAHVILPSGLVQLQPLGYDTTPIRPYLAALDDPAMPRAPLRWLAPNRAEIRAAGLRPEHLVSVQVSWDKGWKAYAGGRPAAAWGDKLGQIVVQPRCTGACQVDLVWDGGTERALSIWASVLALAGGFVWLLVSYVKSIRVHAR
jgi:hypothetical protein